MEERFAAFTVLIAKINRNIRRIKTEEMAEFHLKGPHVACLYHLTTAGPLTAESARYITARSSSVRAEPASLTIRSIFSMILRPVASPFSVSRRGDR